MEEKSLSDEKIYKVLKIVLEKIKNSSLTWRLEGSANLLVQGLNVSVRDIDITTNKEGISLFRKTLKNHLKKDFYNEKIQAQSLVYNINKVELEINAYNNKKLNFFDKIKICQWKNLNLPILPIKEAREFYFTINRKEKISLIDKFLASNHNKLQSQ